MWGLELRNNGHGIIIPGDLGTTTVDGVIYKAINAQFHFPSEHKVDGMQYSGEMHIVHQRYGSDGYDDLLVIGIMLDSTAGTPNTFLDAVGWGSLPMTAHSKVDIIGSVDLGAAFSAQLSGGFYRYDGSLTTPPCTETVKWYVMETPATLSDTQATAFKALYPNPTNARPVQPLGDRHIYKNVLSVHNPPVHWGYTDPWDNHDWTRVSAACASGNMQSPIDIDTHHATVPLSTMSLVGATSFPPVSDLYLKNNGHAIAVAADLGTTTVGTVPYKAIGFQFHFPSEHRIDGTQYAGEMHIVHQRDGSDGDDDLLVIGIILDSTGNVANPFLDAIGWGSLPVTAHSKADIAGSVDLDASFATELSGGFYRYDGSLTTPPCTESVKWYGDKCTRVISGK
eukprot:gene57810-biopygen89600